MDIIGCPRIEDDGTKENAGGQHRADFKADRRGYSAKGVQSGTFARYASLKVGKPDPRTVNSSPALVRGFIVGRTAKSFAARVWLLPQTMIKQAETMPNRLLVC